MIASDLIETRKYDRWNLLCIYLCLPQVLCIYSSQIGGRWNLGEAGKQKHLILFLVFAVGRCYNRCRSRKEAAAFGSQIRHFFNNSWLFNQFHISNMTRGNQRELARAKNQKKQQEQKKQKGNDGLTLEQRKFRDAEMMREKQKKKEEQKQAQACK